MNEEDKLELKSEKNKSVSKIIKTLSIDENTTQTPMLERLRI